MPVTIGPVSRSQMSPNGSTITLANGHSLRARGRGVFVCRDQPDLLTLAPGVNRLGEGRDLALGRLQVAEPQLGIAREADPHRLVRRPFGKGRSHRRRR